MGYSRATLPEEFYDKTSDMLLVQPEAQYLYAMLYLGALRASLTTPGELGNPGRTAPSVGADYSSAERDRLMLSNPMLTEVIAAKVDFNSAPGNVIRINRPAFTNTTYTEASRKIVGGSTISTTAIVGAGAVISEQTSLTLFRYGGPYDSTNSRVAPLAIEAFDANMGVHKAAQINGTTLKRDCHRFLDAVHVTLLDLAATSVYPEGMTADNDATTAGMFPFTYEQLNRTEQKMDDANLPTFGDGFRVLVLTPTQLKQLKDDPQYQRQAFSFPEFNTLFPQYVKSVGKFHIFKSTTLTQANNSSSVAIHKGHAIAPGALLAGMGRPLRVMNAIDDNFGETVKVLWLGDLAFGLADNRFVYSVRSSA
jgi:hypothetical protein